MATIITYDIPAKHMEFKKAMFALGYKDQIPGTNCEIIYFPNTTLYHATKSALTARDESKTICANLKIKLERCVASAWSDWAAVCGEPFEQ